MQRESIIRGPAIVTFNSLTFYSQGDIKLTLDQAVVALESSAYGHVGDRAGARQARVSFTPHGKYITGLWPYAASLIGASIYGSADRDLVIKPLDTTQKMWTIYNAAITKLPDIIMSASKTLIGDVEFTALGKEDTLPSVADSLIKQETNTFADTSFAPADILTQPYNAAWGATLTGIETKDGWKVNFSLGLTDVLSDTYGVVDKLIKSLEVKASCEPLTITEAQLLTALGIDRAMGASLNTGADLVITGTGVSVTVKNSVIQKADPVFGRESNRLGTVEFVAKRKFTTGVPQAMFAVA